MLIPPSLLSLLAAMSFGGTAILAKKGMAFVDPYTSAWVSIGSTLALFWVLAPFMLSLEQFYSPWNLFFAGMGIIQPFASVSFAFAANQRLGPTVGGTIASTAPLVSAAIAVMFLGETITLPIALGTIGVMTGVIVLTWSGRGRRAWAASALLFPIGAAAARGIAHAGGKFGLEHLPNPLLSAFMTYSAAFLIGLIARAPHLKAVPGSIAGPGFKWLLLAGLGNGVGILMFLTALNRGTVVVVSPILATFPMFTLIFSVLFFREELITRRTLAGMLLIVPSVIVIAVLR